MRLALNCVLLACWMGSSLVQAQQAGVKSARQAACERDRSESRAELQTSYQAQMEVCSRQMKSTLGYLGEQGKQFLYETAGWGAGNCASRMTRDFLMMNEVFDKRRDACLLAASKD